VITLCKHLIQRDGKATICGVRGTAYCMMPINEYTYADMDDCPDYEPDDEPLGHSVECKRDHGEDI